MQFKVAHSIREKEKWKIRLILRTPSGDSNFPFKHLLPSSVCSFHLSSLNCWLPNILLFSPSGSSWEDEMWVCVLWLWTWTGTIFYNFFVFLHPHSVFCIISNNLLTFFDLSSYFLVIIYINSNWVEPFFLHFRLYTRSSISFLLHDTITFK